jgi:hypothetical protein
MMKRWRRLGSPAKHIGEVQDGLSSTSHSSGYGTMRGAAPDSHQLLLQRRRRSKL